MFPFSKLPKAGHGTRNTQTTVDLEPLENRQLLSATAAAGAAFAPGGRALDTIAFSLAPAAVQNGLTSLATADGLTDPAATDKVSLGNRDGVETYSVTIRSTGTVSQLTVDAAGQPVTAPAQTTTTFGALATAPAAEITAIATAKSLTAPTSATVVNVTTTAAGAVTYSVALAGDGTATPVASTAAVNPGTIMRVSPIGGGFAVMVDAAGNPVGNQQLPFSVFSTTIQSALNAGRARGRPPLSPASSTFADARLTLPFLAAPGTGPPSPAGGRGDRCASIPAPCGRVHSQRVPSHGEGARPATRSRAVGAVERDEEGGGRKPVHRRGALSSPPVRGEPGRPSDMRAGGGPRGEGPNTPARPALRENAPRGASRPVETVAS